MPICSAATPDLSSARAPRRQVRALPACPRSKKRMAPRARASGHVSRRACAQMRERRLRDIGEGRRQLLDATVGQAAQIVHRPLERRERRAVRLVGHRHGHLAAAGECLQERPLRARQVLEAVREDRLAAPGLELSGDAFAASGAKIAVPCRADLAPSICGIQPRARLEVVRVSKPESSSPTVASSESAKPPKRAERPRPLSDWPASARRTMRARCASVATGRESPPPRASRLKRSSNVPIEPPSRAGWMANSSRSRSSTSDRFGTIRYGSRGSASRYRRSRSATFPALAGPVMRFRPN